MNHVRALLDVFCFSLPFSLLCFLVYIPLRGSPQAGVGCLGKICFLVAVLLLLLVTDLYLADGTSSELTPLFYAGLTIVCFGSLLVGATFVHKASQHRLSWWSSFWFYGFYLTFAQLAGAFTTSPSVERAWTHLILVLDMGFLKGERSSLVSLCCIFLFPLGAPLSEMLVRGFWHTFGTDHKRVSTLQ